ncbi:MAG: hypothetical protein OCD76_08375 [Reichenbachiella sp.]
MSFFRFFAPGIKDNWKVIALSIIGAATFWFFNAMNKNYDTRLDYPIEYIFERDSVVVVSPLQKNVKIIVSSGGWNLLRKTLRINATPIQAPLANPTEIKYLTRSSLIPLISDQLDGLKLTYLVTDTLFFNIEKKITKKLPVRVDSLNAPLRENHRITSPVSLSTDSVVFTGPKTIMEKLDGFVNINFKDKRISANYNEDLQYDIDGLVKASPKEINVKFEVAQFLYKDLTIPLEFLHFPTDSSVHASDSSIKIYYTVNENLENDVKDSDFNVTLDYTMFNQRDSSIVPMLMYAHEEALDIVMSKDKIELLFIAPLK